MEEVTPNISFSPTPGGHRVRLDFQNTSETFFVRKQTPDMVVHTQNITFHSEVKNRPGVRIPTVQNVDHNIQSHLTEIQAEYEST